MRQVRVSALRRTAAVGLVSGLGLSSASALNIVPTWAPNINSDPNAAAIKADIQAAINLYNATFTDPITVNFTFQEGGGLGSSSTSFVSSPFSSFRAALVTDSSTADDTLALAHLPAGLTEPVTGTSSVRLSTANARALGLPDGGATLDCTITLNTSICFTTHNSPVAGQYDLFAVASHEMDEGLGTISGVGGPVWSADMYRYDGAGGRSYTASSTVHAWFSIDSTTNIVEYNQFGRTGGDFGDWVVHVPPQVQDFAGTPGVTVNPGNSEFRLLDVVGYNRAPVPEPASMAVLGLGVLALLRRRRKA